MSSSPTSSSSTDAQAAFAAFLDVPCQAEILLGTGTILLRQCLALERHSIVRLQQSAGEDLMLQLNGTTLARGEIMVVEDSTALRVTEIVGDPTSSET